MREWSKIIHLVDKLNNARILVVGDVMLDRYIYGEVARISPEAPVPVLRQSRRISTIGGAGNVVRNLVSLGSRVYFVSVVGNDPESKEIKDILSSLNRIEAKIITDEERKTTIKTRYIGDRQQILRVDRETANDLSQKLQTEAVRAFEEFAKVSDVVVLSDYGKGFFCQDIITSIIEIGRRNCKPVLVDPKGKDFTRYRRANVLTPNLKELAEATGLPVKGDEAVVTAARRIIDSCDLDGVLATRSQEGMSLIQRSGEVRHFRAEAKEVFDVSGAGDTAMAVLAAGLGVGGSLPESAELANVGAGIAVGKAGTAVVYQKELIQALRHEELFGAEYKIMDLDDAIERMGEWRTKGHRLGFTNGVFDLLHPGHLSLLSQAARACDRLIVGLNGDLSVEKIKGGAPIQNEAARSAILASLEIVDGVVIFQDETPISLITALRPDVLIKGTNYRPEEVVGADIVKSYGGEVVLANVLDIHRTNSTIGRMTKGHL